MFLRAAAALCALPLALASWSPNAVLEVTQQTISPDCTPRVSTVINGTAPGPVLRFKEGQHIFIRVYNKMTAANTTIHWHGLGQRGTPFSDGTPLTSQWPIPPGGYFDYEFQLQQGDAGTYFYHSHVDFQAISASGAFIVEEADLAKAPYKYDEDRVIMLSEAYHANDSTIIAGLIADPFVWLNEPQSLLVNGNAKGTCNATALLPGQSCSSNCTYDVLSVDPGKTYRVRVIGLTGLSYMSMAFENHDNFTLIEADGHYLEPYNASHVELTSGQRYSFLLKTKTADELAADGKNGTYWSLLQTRWRPLKTQGYSLLSYAKQPPNTSNLTAPTTLNQTLVLPNETFGYGSDFAPIKGSLAAPTMQEVTRRIILNGQQVVPPGTSKASSWVVNNVRDNSTKPDVPILVQLYQGHGKPNYTAAAENGGYDPSTYSYPAKKGEVLEVILQNLAAASGQAEAHPWHAHGGHFYLMGGAMGNYSAEALEQIIANSTTPPPIRDTVPVYPGPGASYSNTNVTAGAPDGWVAFRLRVDDVGAWMLHCHILPHMIMGMQTVLLFGAEDLPPLPANYSQHYFTYGAEQAAEPKSYFEMTKRAEISG